MKPILLGAVLLATISHKAVATTETYTFYTENGTAYCDGIQIKTSNGIATGEHIYNQADGSCGYPSAEIGGVEGSLPTLGPGKWYSLGESEATGDSLPTDYTAIIYVNFRALTWRMSVESTNYDIPFEIIFSGTLHKGAPSAYPNSRGVTTVFSAARVLLSHGGR